MAWYNRGKEINKRLSDIEKKLLAGSSISDFPIPPEGYVKYSGQAEKVPMETFSWNYLQSLTYNSDLVRTIIKTLTDEVFKNDIEVVEKYKSKCSYCGREFEEDIMICPYDNHLTIKPNYEEYKKLNELLTKTNNFDETLYEVLKMVDTDVNIGDNGWLIVDKEYLYNAEGDTGVIVGAKINGFYRLSPSKMRLVISKNGMGRGERGEYYFICPNHREELITLQPDELNEKQRCPVCNSQLLPAWYKAETGEGKGVYYSKEEVYHVKRWSNSQGYGVSPLTTVWRKVMTLLKMDDFILKAYSLQRSPAGLLVIKGRYDDVRKSWEWLQQKARENPNMIYPLVIEGQETTRRILEYQQFDLKPQEWSWLDMRKEYRETVGAMFGVQPLFVQGPTQGGLVNEGLQITVTNRTITESQRVWNTVLQWLSELVGAKGYVLRLVPNELEDVIKDVEIETKRLDIALKMHGLGYNPLLKRDKKGLLDFEYENVQEWNTEENINPKEEEDDTKHQNDKFRNDDKHESSIPKKQPHKDSDGNIND